MTIGAGRSWICPARNGFLGPALGSHVLRLLFLHLLDLYLVVAVFFASFALALPFSFVSLSFFFTLLSPLGSGMDKRRSISLVFLAARRANGEKASQRTKPFSSILF